MQAITSAEARRLDRNAAELGVPTTQLMEKAGKALAERAAKAAKGGPTLWFCGKGNNGGDGLCAVQHLHTQGLPAQAVLAERPESLGPLPRSWLDRLPQEAWTVWSGRPDPAWQQAKVLVDCLLGTGLASAPRPPYRQMVAYLNRRRRDARIVACDVPSGVGSGAAVHPHETVTFHAPKVGMTRANSGQVIVADIGIPDGAADVGIGDLVAGYRRPCPDSHKGDNGVVGVLAGSAGLAGAAWYCAMAAYRTGADLVHAFVPADAAATLRAYGPETLVHEVNPGPHLDLRGVAALRPMLRRLDVLLVGPGLGRHPDTRAAAEEALDLAARAGVPVVVDADGLDAVGAPLLRRHGARMVLTPHSREFRDLAGKPANEASVSAYARRHATTVLWKHQGTTVAGGGQLRRCRRGHPTLTVGGTGDVLAGVTAALLAKGAGPFDAACAAGYILGVAGELAAAQRSYGALATDVIEHIPDVLLRL